MSRTETFTELYSPETGYNLMHFKVEPDLGHITGEACPCGPERIKHDPDAEPYDGPRFAVVIDGDESRIERVDDREARP